MVSFVVVALSVFSSLVLGLGAPSSDQFYAPPGDLGVLSNGQVYNQRNIWSLIPVTGVKTVKQVAYRTTNTQGDPSHSVATVFVPQFPSDSPKILSYQFWEDSASINCSPSYSISGGLIAPDFVVGALDFPIWVDYATANGWYVVAADHEGPRSAFIAGHEEGRAGLDGIRATISALGLDADTPVALTGYSGGGHATAWVANLAEQYAPDLNIVGAAYGGVPTDLRSILELLDGGLFSGFVGAGFTGALSAYPDLQPIFKEHTTQQFQDAISYINSTNICLAEILLRYPLTKFLDWVTLPDVWTFPPIVDLLGKESLLSNVSTVGVPVPKFPRFIYHATQDEIVPYPADNQYVQQQCAGGANIQFMSIPVGGHITSMVVGLPGALDFVKKAFEGTTTPIECGTQTPDILTVHSDDLDAQLGSRVADSIRALNGKWTPLGSVSF